MKNKKVVPNVTAMSNTVEMSWIMIEAVKTHNWSRKTNTYYVKGSSLRFSNMGTSSSDTLSS